MNDGSHSRFDDRERIDRLRLFRSENVGPVIFRQLIDLYGDAATALDALPTLAERGGRRAPLRVCPREEAERELEALARLGARCLFLGEDEYPTALAAIDDAPPMLAAIGHTHLLKRPALAIVGARNASINGQRFAEILARDLVAADFVIVSGLARGIDAAAHRGALDGGTIAVVAGGLDIIYPRENANLHREIRNRGLLLSEMPPGTQPRARHFPRRNRIVSGLSLGVVVVEAARRSGSLTTARLAGTQGREVFAVPGSPLDPRCRGTNNLIRQGAGLVESARDVVEGLGTGWNRLREGENEAFVKGPNRAPEERDLATARRLVGELLGPSPIAVDELVRATDQPPSAVAAILLELELAGRLDRQPGGRVALVAEQ